MEGQGGGAQRDRRVTEWWARGVPAPVKDLLLLLGVMDNQ